jgi:hypothetical protein
MVVVRTGVHCPSRLPVEVMDSLIVSGVPLIVLKVSVVIVVVPVIGP